MPIANMRNKVYAPLFDTYEYPASALATSIGFFGTRTQSANGRHITNMPAAGQLPPPNVFHVFGIAFNFIGAALADVNSILQKYAARLVVSGVTQIEAPLDFFPSTGGATGFAATTATTTTIAGITNGQPGHANVLMLGDAYKVTIESNEQFQVLMEGNSVTPGTAASLRCFLLGVWEKPVG